MSLAEFLYKVHRDRRREEIGQQIAESYGYQLDQNGMPLGGFPSTMPQPQTSNSPITQQPLPPNGLDLAGAGLLDINQASNAIAGVESGGNYGALGPIIDNPNSMYHGDRAYGKYQVMGKNIPQWTQDALGTSMTPEEFLNNTKAQDAVFNHRFGGYLQQTGNFEDAASMWHSGRPLAEAQNADDGYTATPDYVAQASQHYNGSPQGGVATPFSQPRQVPGEAFMPDPRLPHDFQMMGMEFLRNGYFQEAMELLSPMQRYAINSNIMRSEYQINSTLTQEAHTARMNEIDRQNDRQDFRHQTASADALLLRQTAQERLQLDRDRLAADATPQFSPETRSQLIELDTGIGNAEAVFDWFDQTGGVDRTISPSDRSYYGSIWATTVLPFMQKMFEAGAMQEAELELFQNLAGDPNQWAELTDKNKQAMKAVIDRMRQMRNIWFETNNPQVGPDGARQFPNVTPEQNYGVPLPQRAIPKDTVDGLPATVTETLKETRTKRRRGGGRD
ncbi:hypothetical protein [Primorskyibacter sp. S87]|uniref:hypothetical protein n=1 Tax=Primorskyibacter sp. S87 TaxID=3415126 RepID=UPI003C7AA265